MSFEFTLRPRTTESQRRLLEIPVEKIVPNPNQPRVTFDDETIAELAQSISQVGLIQPLVVRRSGSGYELVAGERRLRACKSLGMETVTCIVEDSMQEESSAMVALIENLQREDLHYMEEAQCYYALLNNYNLTQEELAKRLGRSQSSIANKLRLLRLSPDVVSAIRENGLSERHARAVLKLKDEEVQLAVIKRTAEKNLSVKDTERLVEKTLDKMYDEKRPGAAPRPAIIRQVRDYRLFMNTVNSAIAVLRDQTERLSKVVRTLLDMSELQSVPRTDRIDIGPMVEEVLTDLLPLAEKKKITLAQEGGNVRMTGSDILIYRVLYNLVENGIKYNKQGGNVTVSYRQEENMAVIHVTDTGQGIPEKCQSNIFQPFYRIDKSRSREYGGVGLGLSFAWESVRLHGGSISVLQSTPEGSTIEVELPV